jgi:hypothetical protein
MKPRLRRGLVHCCQCNIPFISHPCNEGRKDIRCPFGCRRCHRAQKSNERSLAYYQNDQGKKKDQNDKRKSRSPPGEADFLFELDILDDSLNHYLMFLVGAIENRVICEQEINQLQQSATKWLRQHSLY